MLSFGAAQLRSLCSSGNQTSAFRLRAINTKPGLWDLPTPSLAHVGPQARSWKRSLPTAPGPCPFHHIPSSASAGVQAARHTPASGACAGDGSAHGPLGHLPNRVLLCGGTARGVLLEPPGRHLLPPTFSSKGKKGESRPGR